MDDLTQAIAGLKADFDRNIPDFSMEFIATAGRWMGANSESESRLVVLGRGSASLFRRRGPGDSAQRPPGRYVGSIPDVALLAFLDALEHSRIGTYASEPIGPRDPKNVLNVLLSGQLFTFSWGTLRPPVPEPIARLKNLLSDWSVKACPHPVWSLRMTAASLAPGNGNVTARLQFENDGTEAIHIAHPASASFGAGFTFHLKYGERQLIEEGITPAPIEIEIAPLRMPPMATPRLIPILPGQPWQFEFTSALEGHAPRGWTGKFVFLHYLPADILAGVPVFNGALFTEEMTW